MAGPAAAHASADRERDPSEHGDALIFSRQAFDSSLRHYDLSLHCSLSFVSGVEYAKS